MTSRSKADLAARAAQMQKRPARTTPGTPASSEQDTTAPATAPRAAAPRAKPVRITTDLDPQSYRALTTYCTEAAGRMGVARVPHAEVIRALLKELQENEALQSRVFSEVELRRMK